MGDDSGDGPVRDEQVGEPLRKASTIHRRTFWTAGAAVATGLSNNVFGLDPAITPAIRDPKLLLTDGVHVPYDEAVINNRGKPPTSVFLVGKIDGASRSGPLVRRRGLDDDDD